MSKKIKAKGFSKKVLSIEKKQVKVPKFKLITYTMKAVIPVGMYANIQPELTVQANSIESAERAVMPHIEALFAKYREGGPIGQVNVQAPVPAPQVVPKVTAPVAPKTEAVVTPKPVKPETKVEITPAPPTIIMTVPFSRAKTAIQSCTSLEALKLVGDQIEKSVKLVGGEKVELKRFLEIKKADLHGVTA